MATADKSSKKEKNQNIQVFVRVRPINDRERNMRSHAVVDVANNREVVVRLSLQSSHTKRFTFDRAFGPNAQQVEVYKEVVSPLIAEVLAGYNCTVFAYGQTGTGKTHTMVGESSGEGTSWQNDPLAGIIPRALSQLFDELRTSNTEYNVRVSYLELYNEELCDLLSSSMDNSKLRIYEDVNRKGSTIVNGLEEITVYSKNEVYDIMARGHERKKVASTLMNSQSSRSHTVFTIVVHMKENSQKGEELVKIGKLNLVDLAGSENISKAGSDNPAKKERARECVNINQSLLTLGRVITALVEKQPHVPYRESKLTRILQESLGGRTKTSIIATISPGHKDLEETLSTLDYANRAKNIQNKPELNQKLTKQAMIKEFAEEIDKLKKELQAARDKTGVYLPNETYEEILMKTDDNRREIADLLLKKRALEEERERLQSIYEDLEQQHARVHTELTTTRERLHHTATRLEETNQRREEVERFAERQQETQNQLSKQARELLAAADTATSDVATLQDTVDRRRTLEESNREAVDTYRQASTAHRQSMLAEIEQTTNAFMEARNQLQTNIDDSARDVSMTQEMTIQDMNLISARMTTFLQEIMSTTAEMDSKLSTSSEECGRQVEAGAGRRGEGLQRHVAALTQAVAECMQRAAAHDIVAAAKRATGEWYEGVTSRVSGVQQSHTRFTEQARQIESERDAAANTQHAALLEALKEEEDTLASCIEETEREKQEMCERIAARLARMKADARETRDRLQQMLEHLQSVQTSVEEKAARESAELEREREQYTRAVDTALSQHRARLQRVRTQREHAATCLARALQHARAVQDTLHTYDNEFSEGARAITADMEKYSENVTQAVSLQHQQLMAELDSVKQQVEQTTSELVSVDAASSQQLVQCARASLADILNGARDSLHTLTQHAQEATSTAASAAGVVSARSSRLATAAERAQDSQTAALSAVGAAVHGGADSLRGLVARHADLEGRYLMREYREYSPTGNTPLRREYRYPRHLAAVSPHARFLHALRLRPPAASPDSDCIVVESDEGRDASDSDEVSESSASGVSEDSGVANDRQQ